MWAIIVFSFLFFFFFPEYVFIKLPWKFTFGEEQIKESFEALGPTRIGQTVGSLRIVFGSQVPNEQGVEHQVGVRVR